MENKLWRTLQHIWIPSKLTSAYIAGARNQYYNPIRVFLVVLFLFFTVLIINVGDDLDSVSSVSKDGEKAAWQNNFKSKYDSLSVEYAELSNPEIRHKLFDNDTTLYTTNNLSDDLLKEFNIMMRDTVYDNPSINRAILDSLVLTQDTITSRLVFGRSDISDSLDIPGISDDKNPIEFNLGNFKSMDLYRLTPEELKSKHGDGKPWVELGLVQLQKIVKDLGSSLTFLISNGTWAIVLIVLTMAAFFKLLYFRGYYNYVEHVVFHIYGHTRVLLIGLMCMILCSILAIDGISLPIKIAFYTGLIYLFIGMKAHYNQSYFKTLVKYIMTLMAYGGSMILCSIVILLISAILL